MTIEHVRPLPTPSELTQPFWDAATQHRLLRPVCTRCTRSFFTPQVACPHCGSLEWEYIESAGLGTVYSATTIFRPPSPAFAAPYVLAIIDLDEGWSMLSRVVGCAPEAVTIGQRVRVSWDPIDGGFVLPVFELEELS